jgi:predicted nicotinamide N-methyase
MSLEPTVPDAKADPVLRRYDLRRFRLPIAHGTLSMVLPDAGAWIRRGDWAAATLRGAEPPYWVQVWPASVAVARLVAKVPGLAGQRVLDLGCGLGVPGVAAARAGAQVTFADREPDALAFARWNGSRQGGPPPEVVCFDWGSDTLATRYDVIVLADVSYRPVHHLALQRHVSGCLAAGGVVVHADPGRPESLPFVRWLSVGRLTLQRQVRTSVGNRTVAVRLCVAGEDGDRLQAFARALPDGAASVGPIPPSASATSA